MGFFTFDQSYEPSELPVKFQGRDRITADTIVIRFKPKDSSKPVRTYLGLSCCTKERIGEFWRSKFYFACWIAISGTIALFMPLTHLFMMNFLVFFYSDYDHCAPVCDQAHHAWKGCSRAQVHNCEAVPEDRRYEFTAVRS